MKERTKKIRFITILTVIFCVMLLTFHYTLAINNHENLLKATTNLKGVEENTVNNKSNTQSSNQSNTQANTQKATNSTNTQSSSSSKTTTSSKSSNNNLSNLGIKPNDFTGFTPSKTSYDVEVPADVTEVEVYATAQNSSAKITGTGKQELKDGENELSVVVTAEDGSQKTYTINVNKESKEVEEAAASIEKGLSSLKIDGVDISPEFKTDVYEYTAKYVGEEEKIDVKAVATDPKYEVEVTGNKELVDGENIITILVSDDEGENVATYQINLTRTSTQDQEAIEKEQEEARKKEQQQKILIAGGIVLGIIIIIIIIVLVIRHKKKKNLDDEYFEDDYDDYEEESEIMNFDEEPILSKEEAKKIFLSGYEEKEELKEEPEEKPRKKHHSKGKRFK